MKITQRYIFKEFLKYFLLITFSFYIVFVIGDFIERMNHIRNFDIGKIALYYLYNFPDSFNRLLPYILFFSILLSFLNLGRHNEIIIMEVSGIRPLKFVMPIIVFTFILTIVTFINYGFIVPKYKYLAYRLYHIDLTEGDLRYFKEMGKRDLGIVFSKGVKYYLYSKYYDSNNKTIKSPIIIVLDKDLKPIKRIDAFSGTYMGNGKWQFSNYIEREINNGSVVNIKRINKKILSLNLDPTLFNTTKVKPQNYSIRELVNKIKKLRLLGKKPIKFLVEAHLRYAFPFFIFFIPIFTFPLGIKFRRDNKAGILGVGLVIITIYITVFRFSLTLGTSGVISPLIAAWFINILILLALFIFWKIKKFLI
ncbi:LptF/LptG family permease [bacterium]|nr:LptF/LptG family permease [bacterium]